MPDNESSGGIPLGKSDKSLPEQLADLVLAEVMARRLNAGDRLKEEELAQQHAVSRATVREALISLTKQGVVERVPRLGARVAEFSRKDLDDLFELRAMLLGLAAGSCARKAAGPELAEFDALVAGLERMAAEPGTDPQGFANGSIQAQGFLIRWSGNRHLPGVYERLASMGAWQLIRGRATSFLTAELRRQSAADWRALAGRLTAGDVEGSERAARRLLEHSADRVRQQLDGLASGARP